ncbi:MAG TPA: hypothetical protein VF456_09235, partial [Vicinamibacterales bacterium]
YDTLPEQLARNGDIDTRLIVKMDVEGSEWASLIATPDSVLEQIDQLDSDQLIPLVAMAAARASARLA